MIVIKLNFLGVDFQRGMGGIELYEELAADTPEEGTQSISFFNDNSRHNLALSIGYYCH